MTLITLSFMPVTGAGKYLAIGIELLRRIKKSFKSLGVADSRTSGLVQ